MSTVNQLLAEIRKSSGVAKANRYRVYFIDGEREKLNIMCDSVSLPGRQIVTQDYFVDMKGLRRPYAFINEDVTISFLMGNDWYTWNYLNDWQRKTINQIDTVSGNFTVNFRRDYARDVVIEHLDDNNNVRKTITLVNAFPTSLNSLELSNASESTILRCNAVFAYDNWYEGRRQQPQPPAVQQPLVSEPGLFVSDTLG